MAKQQLQQNLAAALNQVKLASLAVKLSAAQAKMSKDGTQVLRNATQLENANGRLDAAIRAAEAHIATYNTETRWKKLKNVAIPKLTTARDRFKAEVTQAKNALDKSKEVVKGTQLLAGTLHWRA